MSQTPHSVPHTPIIREANFRDFSRIYEIFSSTLEAGDTYAYTPEEMTPDRSMAYWMSAPGTHCLVAEVEGEVAGIAAIRPNQTGRGAHVANGSYIVDARFRRQGIARKLSEESIELAKELGYQAMQFNFVVSTNDVAVKLWKSLGFEIVGTRPKGFDHAQHGLTDVYIMHKFL